MSSSSTAGRHRRSRTLSAAAALALQNASGAADLGSRRPAVGADLN